MIGTFERHSTQSISSASGAFYGAINAIADGVELQLVKGRDPATAKSFFKATGVMAGPFASGFQCASDLSRQFTRGAIRYDRISHASIDRLARGSAFSMLSIEQASRGGHL
ncbi:hypothetical protein [Bradyrhizobium sp. 18]|uniref:hypothetical protein n=1 Tax=Bradyrhizobium sp. 18 TaxID=2782657 RepID=UPI001FFAEA4F|nr:hypothetical protein [Bradyrhizobium sp. 18]MCK1506881.1 hypothetical protein [Bradyrhizobium sp. 18]